MRDYYISAELARSGFNRSLKKASKRKEAALKCLLSLEEVLKAVQVSGLVYRGMREIPVDWIVGSVNKPQDFDWDFNPTRRYSQARWMRLYAAAMDQEELPPVELYKLGCFYFVVDGHHRVSVARYLGMIDVEALVTEYITDDLRHIEGPSQMLDWIRNNPRTGAISCV